MAGASRRATARVLGWMVFAVTLWTPAIVLGAAIAGPTLADPVARAAGVPWLGPAASALVVLTLLRLTMAASAKPGLEQARLLIARVRQWEFWPSWLFNAPVVGWMALVALRHRRLATDT